MCKDKFTVMCHHLWFRFCRNRVSGRFRRLARLRALPSSSATSYPQANRGSVPGLDGAPSPKGAIPKVGPTPDARGRKPIPRRGPRERFPPLPNPSDHTSVPLSTTSFPPTSAFPQGGGSSFISLVRPALISDLMAI